MNNNRFDLGPKLNRPKLKKSDDSNKIDYKKTQKKDKTKNFKNDNFENGKKPKFIKKENDFKERLSLKKEDTTTEVANQDNKPREKILAVGTKYKVSFVDYTHEGLAIAKIDTVGINKEVYTNFPVFVYGGVIGETAYIEIDKLQKSYAFGHILTIYQETRSKDRTIPKCPHYGQCGGCNIMHLNYKAQLLFKQQMVKNTFAKIASLKEISVLPTIGMDKSSVFYRNKVQVPVAKAGQKTLCGFYKRDSHLIIPLDECYIQTPTSTDIVKFTKNVMVEYGAVGYDERNESGTFRHILVRKNHDESEIMIVLVVTKKDFIEDASLKEMINKIIKRYKNVVSIIGNINKEKGNTILGEECFTIYGKDTITDTLCGKTFKLGAKSFYQVNHEQTEKLYRLAIEKANLTKEDVIIDAYCGIGTIGIIASDYVKKVYGVEVVKEAIVNAKENATINNVKNIHLVCAKAEDQIVKWMKEEVKPNTIIVDPPRKGCDEKFLQTVIKMGIPKIVYVSCDPATLARDVKILIDNGYVASEVQPVDLFPETSHVETIVCLSLKTEK